MNMPIKQTVYLSTGNDGMRVSRTGYDTYDIVKEQEGYFFTPEQLNEYTANVIKQALETASAKQEQKTDKDWEFKEIQKSIKSSFEETYKQFKV